MIRAYKKKALADRTRHASDDGIQHQQVITSNIYTGGNNSLDYLPNKDKIYLILIFMGGGGTRPLNPPSYTPGSSCYITGSSPILGHTEPVVCDKT